MCGVRRPLVVLLIGIVAAAGLLSGCGGGSSAAPALGPNDVLVANFSFTPATLTVKAGTTVTWKFDQPSVPHNVVSLSTPAVFNSGTPKGTGTFSFWTAITGCFTSCSMPIRWARAGKRGAEPYSI